jgi:hypothetical protein
MEGYATSGSPIVITTPGRKLTIEDRVFRTDFQRHWLSVNVTQGCQARSQNALEMWSEDTGGANLAAYIHQ